MQSNSVTLRQFQTLAVGDYDRSERQFLEWLRKDELLDRESIFAKEFEWILSRAIELAYQKDFGTDAAHCFLQRILYQINRLKLSCDPNSAYYNDERSLYLRQVRNRIETAWENWELAQIDVAGLPELDAKQALIKRVKSDLQPQLSPDSQYIREQMGKIGYQHLSVISSFDCLLHGKHLWSIVGSTTDELESTSVKVVIQEYANGRLPRRHPMFVAQMLTNFGINNYSDKYFNLIPWEVLACVNYNYLLSDRESYFLRYVGGLTCFEVAGATAYKNYQTAEQRLGLSPRPIDNWQLHIQQYQYYKGWILNEVALCLAEIYPNRGWELILGYDQQKLIGDRAACSVVRSIREEEQAALLLQEIQKVKSINR